MTGNKTHLSNIKWSTAARQILNSPATYEEMKIKRVRKIVNRPPGGHAAYNRRWLESIWPMKQRLHTKKMIKARMKSMLTKR